MRYFLTLAYQGTAWCGWQRQPNARSVQETLENALATILRSPGLTVTGCGRTDTGVHARYYVAHVDFDSPLPDKFLHSLNGVLPRDIAVYSVKAMHAEAHARFDAFERAYEYHISLRKDPFSLTDAWQYPSAAHFDLDALQSVAQTIGRFQHFEPFCKSNSGLDSFACDIVDSRWERQSHRLIYHVAANRFLRGMVRLIVGASVQVAAGRLNLSDIEQALETRQPLPQSLSAPPEGLALTRVVYPYAVV